MIVLNILFEAQILKYCIKTTYNRKDIFVLIKYLIKLSDFEIFVFYYYPEKGTSETRHGKSLKKFRRIEKSLV